MHKKIIAVLFGGMSSEYPVSLQSAHAVITHLNTGRYVPVLVGITPDGRWLRYRGPAQDIANDRWAVPEHCTPAFISPCRNNPGLVEYGTGVTTFTRLDAALPVLHGRLGEDGTVQGLLELAGIPIVGCGTASSATCMDKDLAHRLAASAGIPVPGSAVFCAGTPREELQAAAEGLGYPLFVKPLRAGSSFGISRVEGPRELAGAAAKAAEYDGDILLEQAIEGFEVGCAVMGDGALTVGALDEVELSGGFFDYTEKYNLVTSSIHVPARVAPALEARVKAAAQTLYRLLRCSGFARVDFFVTPAGGLYFNEINTIPGFTAHSRFPSMMRAAGLDFSALLDKLVQTAVSR